MGKNLQFKSQRLIQPALIIKAVLTRPAGVAATVAAHWITAISMATVTALTTLQPIGAILTMIETRCYGHSETPYMFFTALFFSETYRAGLIAVLSPPPRRTCADAVYRVTCGSVGT